MFAQVQATPTHFEAPDRVAAEMAGLARTVKYPMTVLAETLALRFELLRQYRVASDAARAIRAAR